MRAFKGFNKDLTCRGYQYEEGKEFHTERAECCDTGFHACEYPLDCFGYYDPAHSVYHEVELSGEMDKSGDNTKVCATDIKIGARLDLKEIFTEKEVPKEKKKKEEKTTLPMLRFGSNSVRITEDELVMLSNRYNEYVECTPDEGFITWLLKRGL